MDNDVAVGLNRTGLDMAPKSKGTLVDFAREQASRASQEPDDLHAMRKRYALESDASARCPCRPA